MNSLAIVIPYYKLTFFRETLASLVAQTDQRFHVYIGNDASPENPEDVLKEFEGKFKFKYKKFEENLGGISLTKQWERCIEMIQEEEWFMILGDDDYMDAAAVQGFHETIDKNENNLKVLRYKVEVINEKENRTSGNIVYVDGETSTEFIEKRAQGLVRNSLSEYVFRATDFHKYGIRSYPKAFYSDNLMVLEYSDFGPIYNVGIGKIFVRVSDISLTGNDDTAKFLSEAGSLFYTDLLTEYSGEFTVNQKNNFLRFMFDGYLLKKTPLTIFEVFTIILKNSNIKRTSQFFILLMKYKLIILLNKNILK